MRISHDVRALADAEGVSPEEALELGMQAKAVEFRSSGSEVYRAPAEAEPVVSGNA
jgi:phosphomethylpyrimidine synthase